MGHGAPEIIAERLLDTQLAFDSVASDYDGPRGNNALIQTIRRAMWTTVTETFTAGARLADLGCGTGLDAAFLSRSGYRVVALDWSPEMIRYTQDRIVQAGLQERVTARHVGIHEIKTLDAGLFDGMYSNLGALNCVPDLGPVARACASHLRPGGRLVFSVIGRYCPWEMAAYVLKGQPARAFVRMRRGAVPVGLNGGRVWTRYYTPSEFYRPFEADFELTHYRALCLFSPPPYLIALHRKAPRLCEVLARLDERFGAWPLLKNAGDHFMMVLTKRD
jgi:2-polyprenyl-3-methyl-5-hydroxy-6-metoxy-1,4-benzoquinol methylase